MGQKKSFSLKSIRWIYVETGAKGWQYALLALLLLLAMAAQILVAYVLKGFIDIASHQSELTLSRAVGQAALILVVGGAVSVLAYTLKTAIYSQALRRLREKLLTQWIQSKSHQRRLSVGEGLALFSTDCESLAQFLPQFFQNALGNMFLFLMALISMLILSPKLSLILLVSLPLIILVLIPLNIPIGRQDKKRKQTEDQSQAVFEEGVTNAGLLSGNQLIHPFLRQVSRIFKANRQARLWFGLWEGLAFFINNVVSTLMVLVLLGAGAYLVIQGETTLGTLVAMLQLLNYIADPLSKISAELSKLAQLQVSVDRLSPLYDLKVTPLAQQQEGDQSEKSLIERQPDPLGKISLQQLNFAYEGKAIFEDFSAEFAAGKMTCLTGPNGSGKSTLLKLLAGLNEPDQGKISFVSKSGAPLSIKDKLSLQLADELPFTGSVEDNITLFEGITEDQRAEQSGWMDAFLKSGDQPLELKRQVNRTLKPVSSGELKKMGLARTAWLDREVVLLDEPSANLDAQSISVLIQFIESLKASGRCVIVVSHDPLIIEQADQVIRLDPLKN